MEPLTGGVTNMVLPTWSLLTGGVANMEPVKQGVANMEPVTGCQHGAC